MASASEDVDSRKVNLGRSPSAVFKYTIVAASDELEARLAMLAVAPIGYEGLWRLTGEIDPVGNGVYKGTITYGMGERQGSSPQDQNQGGNDTKETDSVGPELAFDIKGVTKKITKSILVRTSIKRKDDTSAIPDTKGAIGFSGKGLEGCDVEDTLLDWSETWSFPAGTLTWGYIKTLRALHSRTNDETFRSFDAGEVRFAGAHIRSKSGEKITITYNFVTAKNPATDFAATFPQTQWEPPLLQPGAWDFVDVRYVNDVNSATKLMVPRYVYIHKVYMSGSFKALNIGL